MKPECDECRSPILYDLIVDDGLWEKISPKPVKGFKGGGLLCPECILSKALLEAEQRGRREGMEEAAKGQTLPDAEFYIGQPVEKFTGEALWEGVVVSTYHTTKGKMRYVVEVQPQGFQMIAVPSQLRAKHEEVQP